MIKVLDVSMHLSKSDILSIFFSKLITYNFLFSKAILNFFFSETKYFLMVIIFCYLFLEFVSTTIVAETSYS